MITQVEIDNLKNPDSLNVLLKDVESLTKKASEKDAYNYMIDYLENQEWFSSHEGQRLLDICLTILLELKTQ